MSSQPSNFNLLSPEGFILSFSKIPNVAFFVQQMTTPDITIGTVPVANPTNREIFYPGDQITFGDVVLSFMVDEDLTNYKELYQWMLDSTTESDRDNIFSDATLSVLNNSKRSNVELKFENCFPYNLGALVFDTTVGPDIPIKADVTLKFTRFTIV